jgi:predicted DNA-binding protein
MTTAKMKITVIPLKKRFEEAVEMALKAESDTREAIEHHLEEIHAHCVALDSTQIVCVIGRYQDNINYTSKAMDDGSSTRTI